MSPEATICYSYTCLLWTSIGQQVQVYDQQENIPKGCVPSASDHSHQMSARGGGGGLYSGVPCLGGG